MSALDESSSLISSDRTVRWLFAVMVGLFVVTVLSFGLILHSENVVHRYVALANELRVMSQQLPLLADEALRGNEAPYAGMKDSRQRFQRNLVALEAGDDAVGIPASPSGAMPKLEEIKTVWKDFGKSVDVLVDHQQVLQNTGRQLAQLRKRLQELSGSVDQVSNNLLNQQIEASLLSRWLTAQRYAPLAEQAVIQLERALSGGGDVKRLETMFTDLQQNEAAFAKLVEAFLKGNSQINVNAVGDQATRELLREVDAVFRSAQGAFADIYDDRNDLLASGAAAGLLFNNADKLGDATGALLEFYTGPGMARMVPQWVPLVLFACSMLLLGALWVKTNGLERQRLEQSEREKRLADEQAERNQKAIMRLLDEIEGLSEGDLTVHASVDEAFTGAIADSFNTAIDALRSLVTTINETAVQVSSAAEETQATALHLTEAADHQAHQITAASAAVNEMAVSIDQVSQNAGESAEVAKRAVTLAHKGADTVRRTITGMDTIREQIQETSKRIKRLGESSQEIGNIVELINDIADQTNILALNASIQAAMAGDAGRGFAVVADEVQRLAERSSNATKQIEALVKTIQSDTNEAVISMEQSTAEVVNGAKLAQDGGEALKEIEQVSATLANLILSISEAAKQQASAAASISDTMNVIQEITTQTAAGTNETATSIGNLAELANELRTSVAGFKLPA